jgi:hypothetical protein
MAKSETLLEKRVTKACRKRGVRTIKVDPDDYNGFPDRIIFNILVGEIHYAELKNNTYYERTKNQKRWARIIKDCNGKYFLLDGDADVDWYIKKYIEAEGK